MVAARNMEMEIGMVVMRRRRRLMVVVPATLRMTMRRRQEGMVNLHQTTTPRTRTWRLVGKMLKVMLVMPPNL
jgi:hypothetical protein